MLLGIAAGYYAYCQNLVGSKPIMYGDALPIIIKELEERVKKAQIHKREKDNYVLARQQQISELNTEIRQYLYGYNNLK